MKYRPIPNTNCELAHYLPLSMVPANFCEKKLAKSKQVIALFKRRLAKGTK